MAPLVETCYDKKFVSKTIGTSTERLSMHNKDEEYGHDHDSHDGNLR